MTGLCKYRIGEMGGGEGAMVSGTGGCGKYPWEMGGVSGKGESAGVEIGTTDSDT